MARKVQKKLATPNVNVYFGQLGKPQSELKGVLHYDGKPYIAETLQADLQERNHDDPLARHFGVEKTLELLTRKYYWRNMRTDIEKYVQCCNICMSSKAQRHKLYGSLPSLPVPTHKWKDLSIDFVTRLPRSKDWRGVEYDSILVIVDRLTKMVHYEPVLTTLDAEQLAAVLIETVIKYHGLPNFIVTDRGSLFTLKIWSSLCYYLNVKRRLSTAFYPQTDRQTERQNSTMKAYLQAYCWFEQDDWVRQLPMTKLAYNNSWQASTIMSLFEALLSYHPQMAYKDNRNPQSKSRAADKNAATLRDLIKELKVNLTES